MSGEIEKILATKERLDQVSPSFCLAKWLQVTIHLQNGTTHSCHHPAPHKVPLAELARDPSALHNTGFKKEQRAKMLAGERPKVCQYCWNIEDAPGDHISDRHIKSHDPWAQAKFDAVLKAAAKTNVNPTYAELSFSNTCNFKCAYCGPHASSKWVEEIRTFGPYPTAGNFNDLKPLEEKGMLPIPESEHNPYVEAFWKWWPELYPSLQMFRITGGEPLLSPHTFRVLDYIDANPRPDLELAINSNLGVPEKLIKKFADRLETLTASDKIKSFQLYTSLDSWGAQAEYIRFGLDIKYFWKNVRYLLERLPKIQIVFMCTFNALSVTNFKPLLENLVSLKDEFFAEERHFKSPAILDISYLRHPELLSVKVLPPEYLEQMNALMDYMDSFAEERYKPYRGFYDFERAKMRRLIEWMQVPMNPLWTKTARADFTSFIREYDRRRGTDFVKIFPEMAGLLK